MSDNLILACSIDTLNVSKKYNKCSPIIVTYFSKNHDTPVSGQHNSDNK